MCALHGYNLMLAVACFATGVPIAFLLFGEWHNVRPPKPLKRF
jgi:hypothetical protein